MTYPESHNLATYSSSTSWIVSRKFDLAIFLTPLFLAAISPACLLLGNLERMPFWIFLLTIVAFDVAHVWATIYRTYLDDKELWRRKYLYFAPLPLFFLLSFRLYYTSPTLFWSILAYVAIYHFIKQNYGFVALYKVKKGERSSFDFYLDKGAVWAGALGPVLWWHASPHRQFDWFNAGEKFIFHLNPGLLPDLTFLYFGILTAYIFRQIYLWHRKRYFNPGKNLIMTAHFITWAVGIKFTDNPIISAAFLNLFHGIPFIALVWYYCHNKWCSVDSPSSNSFGSKLMTYICRPNNWYLFYGLIFILACTEEFLWDGTIWQTYLPYWLNLDLPTLGHLGQSVCVAILSLPQIMHYFLDAYIWKFDGSNPDLKRYLGLNHIS